MGTASEPRLLRRYSGRFFVYSIAAVSASFGGSLLNQLYGNWGQVGPGGILLFAFGLAPAITIVSFARLSARGVAGVCVLVVGSMVMMWWLFVSDDSSTAVLAFLAGWIYGIPVALVIVVVSWFRSRGSGPEALSLT
jgi:hypothetical protein